MDKNTANYNLHLQIDVSFSSLNSTYKRLKSLRYHSAVIWNYLPETLKSFNENLKQVSKNENHLIVHAGFIKHV